MAAKVRLIRNPLPTWVLRALQGITYWIGHRRALYSGYPLGEAALVAELCNLIYAHLDKTHVLRCEVQFTELLDLTAETGILTAKARADIVVSRKASGKSKIATPEWVIEVKRASASKSSIDTDLERLAAVKQHRPTIHAYLLVIAEAARPARFVTNKGFANSKSYRIPGTSQLYRVRSVKKAAHAFIKRDKAQYACLIEVTGVQSAKRLKRFQEWPG